MFLPLEIELPYSVLWVSYCPCPQVLIVSPVLQNCPLIIIDVFNSKAPLVMGLFIGTGALLVGKCVTIICILASTVCHSLNYSSLWSERKRKLEQRCTVESTELYSDAITGSLSEVRYGCFDWLTVKEGTVACKDKGRDNMLSTKKIIWRGSYQTLHSNMSYYLIIWVFYFFLNKEKLLVLFLNITKHETQEIPFLKTQL